VVRWLVGHARQGPAHTPWLPLRPSATESDESGDDVEPPEVVLARAHGGIELAGCPSVPRQPAHGRRTRRDRSRGRAEGRGGGLRATVAGSGRPAAAAGDELVALVALVHRGDDTFVPTPDTAFEPGTGSSWSARPGMWASSSAAI